MEYDIIVMVLGMTERPCSVILPEDAIDLTGHYRSYLHIQFCKFEDT